MESRSGRSSRSSLIETKRSFISAAVSGSSNDSRSITWHQWQAEYPIESRIGRSSSRARRSASSPQGYQSTGLSLCWRRYGELSSASRFGIPEEATHGRAENASVYADAALPLQRIRVSHADCRGRTGEEASYRSPFEPPRVSGEIGLGRIGSGRGAGADEPVVWAAVGDDSEAMIRRLRLNDQIDYPCDDFDGQENRRATKEPDEAKQLSSVTEIAAVHMEREIPVDFRDSQRLRVLDVVCDQRFRPHRILPIVPWPENRDNGCSQEHEHPDRNPGDGRGSSLQRRLAKERGGNSRP